MLRPSILALVAIAACASPHVHQAPEWGNGSLGGGGQVSGQVDDADPYALRVTDGDAELECAGSVVVFEQAVTTGMLDFGHSADGSEWTLQLPTGEARVGAGELVVAGERHALRRGWAYRFAADGRLVESGPR